MICRLLLVRMNIELTICRKLLFPHAKISADIPKDEFVKYCLEPAKAMRQVIRNQLHVIAPKEYDNPAVPDIQYKD